VTAGSRIGEYSAVQLEGTCRFARLSRDGRSTGKLAGDDRLGRGDRDPGAGPATRSAPRIPEPAEPGRQVGPVPYCAVGCGQNVYVKERQGHPDRGGVTPDLPGQPGPAVFPRARPACSSTHRGGAREYRVKYRRPFGTEWEDLDLDTAIGHDRGPGPSKPAAPAGSRRWTAPATRRTLGFAKPGRAATLDKRREIT